MGIADQRVGEMLADLASKSPVPGGGGIAALTGAMAAGLGEMVLAYSVVQRLAPHHADIEKARAELAEIRASFVQAADDDAAAYARLNAVMRIKDRTPDQDREFREAASAATGAPVRVMRLAGRMLTVFDGLEGRWNDRLASDMAMAALLAMAAARSAWWNVRMNTPLLRDAGGDMTLVAFVDSDLDQCDRVARQVEGRAHAAVGA
jgi:formiminotetrahydrofolate cyclodeaminase